MNDDALKYIIYAAFDSGLVKEEVKWFELKRGERSFLPIILLVKTFKPGNKSNT